MNTPYIAQLLHSFPEPCVLCAQLCPTFCNPMDYSLPGCSVHGIIQARILECVVPFPTPGDLPDSGIGPMSFVSPASAGRFFTNLGSPLRGMKETENEVVQLCPTLRDPMDCILPGSSIHGIFQARTLEWITISFSKRSSQPRD